MKNYFSITTKAYFRNFSGISALAWQGIILIFIEAIMNGVSFFLSIYFVKILSMDVATSGIIISCYGIGSALGGVVGGKLSDRISPRIICIFSLLLQALAFIALLKLQSIAFLMINILILGAASYGFITSTYVWTLNHCKNNEAERLKVINVLCIVSNLGIGFSAVVISFVSKYGFHFIFMASASILCLTALYLIFKVKKVDTVSVVANIENITSVSSASMQNNSQKIFWITLLCLFSAALIVSQLKATYSLYLLNAFPLLGMKAVGILFMLNTLITIFFQAPIVNQFKHSNKLLMVGISAFLMGLGMVTLNFAFIFFIAIVACIIYTLGEMTFSSMTQLVCYQKAPSGQRGYALGMWRATFASSMIVGPAVGSYIYQHLGGNVVWYLSFIIGLVCLLVCNRYKKLYPS